MIVVRVELHSAITGRRTELARMLIDNVGGTKIRGDYRCRTLRGRSAEALDRREVQREGKVRGFAKRDLHVWNLVTLALRGMGYGQ